MIAQEGFERMASAPTKLAIVAKTAGEMLREKNLHVPPSQRSYRWKDEHVRELYADMRTAIDDNDGPLEHFIGTVVGIESGGKIMIYDGQQRLATSMILIAAIRDYFVRTDNEDDAKTTESDLLFSRRRGSASTYPHFSLNAEDAHFFRTRILAREDQQDRIAISKSLKSAPDSHKRIDAAAKIAKEYVDALTNLRPLPDAHNQLNNWIDFIEKQLRIIWVQVADERTAFTIFETMNDRGLKLSAADLLKNYLHSRAGERRDEIIHKWDSMAGVVKTIDGEQENTVEYIRCFWVMKYGHTRTRELYDKIKASTANEDKALALASDLENTVQDYAALIVPSNERMADRESSVKLQITTLSVLGVTQFRPVLLSAFQKVSHGEFGKLVERCVSWSVRFLITGTPSGTIEGFYAKIAAKIWRGEITTAQEASSDMAGIIPDDKKFKAAMETASVPIPRIARYYLQALQKVKDGESQPQYVPNTNSSEITLEHVLPQKPPEGTWMNFTADEKKAYVNRLGNLALLPKNSNGKMGSLQFSEKKDILNAVSEYSLTKEIGLSNSWAATDIDERQNRLAELAVKTWPIT